MNIQTIQMDPRIARIHYRDYVDTVRAHRKEREAKRIERAKAASIELHRVRSEKTQMEKEDCMLLQAYKALAKGDRIVNVHSAITKAGLNEQQLPKLAILRADFQKCSLTINGSRLRFYQMSQWRQKEVVDIQFTEKFGNLSDWNWRKTNNFPAINSVEALVPTIPPHLRPKDLANYHILWEAEWKRVAPVDPLLLRRINDTFFTVIAQWDLTPLERSVLEGRLTP